MAKREENKEKDVLYRIDGKGVILKVKQSLEIGKMTFSFVQYDDQTKKAVGNIDCYIGAEQFGATLIKKILGEAPYQGHSLLRELAAEKANAEKEGRQYPNAVWTSPIGGKKTEDGAISRSFTIAPGSRSEVLFTANEYDADESSTGAFVAKKGSKPRMTIRVPATYNDLIVLAYNWSWLEADYFTKKYSLENMRSEYRDRTEEQHIDPKPAREETPAQASTQTQATEDTQTPVRPFTDARQIAVKSCYQLSYLEKSKLYCLQVITSDGTKHAVYVNKAVTGLEKWPEFQKKAAVSGFKFVGLFLDKNPEKGDLELVGFPA